MNSEYTSFLEDICYFYPTNLLIKLQYGGFNVTVVLETGRENYSI
jgi:hypothetical protein